MTAICLFFLFLISLTPSSMIQSCIHRSSNFIFCVSQILRYCTDMQCSDMQIGHFPKKNTHTPKHQCICIFKRNIQKLMRKGCGFILVASMDNMITKHISSILSSLVSTTKVSGWAAPPWPEIPTSHLSFLTHFWTSGTLLLLPESGQISFSLHCSWPYYSFCYASYHGPAIVVPHCFFCSLSGKSRNEFLNLNRSLITSHEFQNIFELSWYFRLLQIKPEVRSGQGTGYNS